MKKGLITLLAVAFVLALVLPTLAAKPNIQHFDEKFNIIGHPKNVDVLKNDAANGSAIFVPLKNANRDSLQCTFAGDAIVMNQPGCGGDTEPVGAKIISPTILIIKIRYPLTDATDADGRHHPGA
jgi:hypothetical protein